MSQTKSQSQFTSESHLGDYVTNSVSFERHSHLHASVSANIDEPYYKGRLVLALIGKGHKNNEGN